MHNLESELIDEDEDEDEEKFWSWARCLFVLDIVDLWGEIVAKSGSRKINFKNEKPTNDISIIEEFLNVPGMEVKLFIQHLLLLTVFPN